MANPKVLITSEQIQEKVAVLADCISEDYHDRNPLFIGILKGSFVFMADLVRCMHIPLEIDFIMACSYGAGTVSSGRVEVLHDITTLLEGRDVLVVEDIVDTGISLSILLESLCQKNPASVRLCALLDKPSRRKKPIIIDYLGFTVPDKFIVGYGIDFAEKYRYLPDICCLDD